MVEAMRRAALEPPRFRDERTAFRVEFRNHTLMGPDTIAWLNQFAALPLNDHQRVALAHLRHNEQIANSDYRRLNLVDAGVATRDLRRLVQLGLIVPRNTGRATAYALAVPADIAPVTVLTVEERILTFVRERGTVTNADVRQLLAFSFEQASALLTKMYRGGALSREGAGRWTYYRLPLTSP